MSEMKRITVTLTQAQWKLVDSTDMGIGASDKIRGIVQSWLAEHHMITSAAKKKLKTR